MCQMTPKQVSAVLLAVVLLALTTATTALGQGGVPAKADAQRQGAPESPNSAEAVDVPPGYVIGPEDVLAVLFRYDKDLTTDVTVRPDGKITLPMLNDIQAAGLTPEQLRDAVIERAARFIEDPSVTIIVKQINSLKVFITGEVNRPGAYTLVSHMTVLQLVATAGGLTEYAKSKQIVIMRPDLSGIVTTFRFNYKDAIGRRDFTQNIELKAGDTVIVP